MIKICGKDIGNRAEGGVRKCSHRKQDSDGEKIRRENCRNQKCHTEPTKNHQCQSCGSETPPAFNQMSGCRAGEEITEIRGDEWDPNCNKSTSKLDPLCNEKNREPVGHEEKHRISERFRNNHSPRLRKLEKIDPASSAGTERVRLQLAPAAH